MHLFIVTKASLYTYLLIEFDPIETIDITMVVLPMRIICSSRSE